MSQVASLHESEPNRTLKADDDQLYLTVTTNEDENCMGEIMVDRPNALKFRLKMLDLIVEQKTNKVRFNNYFLWVTFSVHSFKDRAPV